MYAKTHQQRRKQRSWRTSCLLLWIPFILVLSCSPVRPVYENEEPRRVPFRTHGGIPLIQVKLNGKTAHFIVDTGASVSLLNEGEAEYFGFQTRRDEPDQEICVTGLNGTTTANRVSSCVLQLGTLTVKSHHFKSRDMVEFSKPFMEKEGIRLAGILGSDLMTYYHLQIDYKNHVISFK
jgi:hypothetical protein